MLNQKNRVIIEPIKRNIEVLFIEEKVKLSKKLEKDIDNHWQLLVNSRKLFKRGDVFTVYKVIKSSRSIKFFLKLTDYAHYLYTIYNPKISQKDRCKVISTSALLETTDDYLIIGEMNMHTSSPKRLQCAGGGIDRSDFKNERADLEGNIKRELF